MTKAYDIALVAASCERLAATIDGAARHPLPDWMRHRMSVVRSEATGLAREIEMSNSEILESPGARCAETEIAKRGSEAAGYRLAVNPCGAWEPSNTATDHQSQTDRIAQTLGIGDSVERHAN